MEKLKIEEIIVFKSSGNKEDLVCRMSDGSEVFYRDGEWITWGGLSGDKDIVERYYKHYQDLFDKHNEERLAKNA